MDCNGLSSSVEQWESSSICHDIVTEHFLPDVFYFICVIFILFSQTLRLCAYVKYCCHDYNDDNYDDDDAGPSAWNSLPDSIHTEPNSAVFRKCLKTHFFCSVFNIVNLLFAEFTHRWLCHAPMSFLSASLYVSKRGAYWDRLCRDVVGWLVVGHSSLVVTRVHCGQTVHPRPIVTMEH